ncbi:hypothetical protein [Paeniglutamicibacter cryotolerans]|uniref:HutD family protein n=1 Tax=Paeniglutamicibacter cryotolerans TaxID=670079 RepID=A0A839QJT6_9MICC|nr:hypothetical protein [Paeniglutamicibacter cryotolerans]MBB2996097.1 hypothetical protein [Paeniglutamicibacter cryotolerans]
MRLLLRANAHRVEPSGETEIAASPDTHGRERWQWDVRLAPDTREPLTRPAPDEALGASGELKLSDGGVLQVMVRSSPHAAVPSVEIHQVGARSELKRQPQEIMVLLSGGPGLLVEGRHQLGRLDALILEGDDPFSVPLEAEGADSTPLAVIRLKGRTALGWVP